MIRALAKLERASLSLPTRLERMLRRYAEAAREGRAPAPLFRNGAALLNRTFRAADNGCEETLRALRRDNVRVDDLVRAAEAFETAADEAEREEHATRPLPTCNLEAPSC